MNSFSHADQPQPSASLCVRCIKPHTLITDLKFKFPGNFLQAYSKVLLAAMPHRIVQSFLNYAKESDTSGGKESGIFLATNSTATPLCSATSRQKPLTAVARPRLSRIEG